jgi:hypothetical protein
MTGSGNKTASPITIHRFIITTRPITGTLLGFWRVRNFIL